MPKIPFYVPYDYYEEQGYDSKEGLIEELLDESQKNDEKEFSDIDALSGSVSSGLVASAEYDKDSNSLVLYNASDEPISTVSLSAITVSGLIVEAYYDKTTKKIIIKFENGDEIQIDVTDIVDISEAGDGLVVEDDIMKVKIDESSDGFISVSADGVKVDGINSAITDAVAEETARAEAAESGLQASIEAEEVRASAQESALTTLISDEIVRATGAEDTLDGKIDDEIARAEAAEETLADNIEAEAARAQSAETVWRKLLTKKLMMRLLVLRVLKQVCRMQLKPRLIGQLALKRHLTERLTTRLLVLRVLKQVCRMQLMRLAERLKVLSALLFMTVMKRQSRSLISMVTQLPKLIQQTLLRMV